MSERPEGLEAQRHLPPMNKPEARATVGQRVFAWGQRPARCQLRADPDEPKQRLLSSMRGTILEIGPGSGSNLRYLDPSAQGLGSSPTRPCTATLRRPTERAGGMPTIASGPPPRCPPPPAPSTTWSAPSCAAPRPTRSSPSRRSGESFGQAGASSLWSMSQRQRGLRFALGRSGCSGRPTKAKRGIMITHPDPRSAFSANPGSSANHDIRSSCKARPASQRAAKVRGSGAPAREAGKPPRWLHEVGQ